MAKIVTVYERSPREMDVEYGDLIPTNMSYIRWFKIAESLANLGHQVDIAIPDYFDGKLKHSPLSVNSIVKKVPLSQIRWCDYDIVKTVFHRGFDTLEIYGGIGHPFIISKLGSVVSSKEQEGIYFYGKTTEQMFLTQEKIHKTSRYVILLSQEAKKLWQTCFGSASNVILVPGAVDQTIPPPEKDPFDGEKCKKCIFIGNVYDEFTQPEANQVLIAKLNKLGKLLIDLNIRLFMVGTGDVSNLDERFVHYLGIVPYLKSWDFIHFADVGIVVSAGMFMHNNESSKIYYYLRAGLPIVSENGFPNDYLIPESKLGFLVKSGNLEDMAERINEAANKKDWDQKFAQNYILNYHTWDMRIKAYNNIINNI